MKKDKKLEVPESITIANYQKLAMRTCMQSCKNKDYAWFGFRAEIGEVFGKIAKQIRGDEITKQDFVEELGDCFWFCALACELDNIEFEKIYNDTEPSYLDALEMPLSTQKTSKTRITACFWTGVVKGFCKYFEINPVDCLESNIRKLASRYNRNVIKGNGDNR